MSKLLFSATVVSAVTFPAELWIRQSSSDVTGLSLLNKNQSNDKLYVPQPVEDYILKHFDTEACSKRPPSGNLVGGLPLVAHNS